MPDQPNGFILDEFELVFISAYFLSLPVPPLLSAAAKDDQRDLESLKVIAEGLVEKGWLRLVEEGSGEIVLPELARHLRDMAYGNEMVYLYIHEKDHDPRQLAFYHHEGRFVGQELLPDCRHVIFNAEELGESLVLEVLQKARQGLRGDNSQIPLEAWQILLTSRRAGITEDLVPAITEAAQKSGGEASQSNLQFVQDVLEANVIMILNSVSGRLYQRQEKAVFVLGDESNWLAVEVPQDEVGSGRLYAVELERKNLIWAAESVFAALKQKIDEGNNE